MGSKKCQSVSHFGKIVYLFSKAMETHASLSRGEPRRVADVG